jgi:excisionase family DNA binding protein
MNQEPITITIEEAVRLSSLGRSFIYERLSDGSIHSVKARKRRLILYASFKEWLTSLPSGQVCISND